MAAVSNLDKRQRGAIPAFCTQMNREYFCFTILILGVLGAATDVVGTYIAQPELHMEGNPLASALAYAPTVLRWPLICIAKLTWVSVCVFCMQRCVRHCESSHLTKQAPLLQVIRSYGHVGAGGVVRRYIVMCLGFCACLWLAAVYAGVENVAYHLGWWKPLGFTFRGLWIPYGVIAAGFVGMAATGILFGVSPRPKTDMHVN